MQNTVKRLNLLISVVFAIALAAKTSDFVWGWLVGCALWFTVDGLYERKWGEVALQVPAFLFAALFLPFETPLVFVLGVIALAGLYVTGVHAAERRQI